MPVKVKADPKDRIAAALGSLVDALNALPDPKGRIEAIGAVRASLHAISPVNGQPVDYVRWVPVEDVTPNDYNPNSVASIEMGLLYTSILHDGYTQPVVTVWDDDAQKYVIVDGFHRYFTCRQNADIRERNHGFLPIVVIDKPINDRMASTVRHNRARGKHSIAGMANMVFRMLDEGWQDADICNELGMQPEELLRLKHITGFSKLFQNVAYQQAWTSNAALLAAKRIRDKGKA